MLAYKNAIVNELKSTQKLPLADVEQFDGMIKNDKDPMNSNFWYLFTKIISQFAQMHKETGEAMTEWEWHFQKLQHGLTLDENNPNCTESSEENNHIKKLPKNDAGSSQNKSYDRQNTKNMTKRLQAIPKYIIHDKVKTLDAQGKTFSHKTINTKAQSNKKCQSLCFCSQKYIWDSDHENIDDINGSLKICSHCKKEHEYCLNYNSEGSNSFWADMMEKDLEWNQQQNLDDETQEMIHNMEF